LPTAGKSDWLAGQVRRAIAEGRLPLGSRLPASRALAGELHVSRGVVTEAYRRLTEDGHLLGHGRGGTVVVASPWAPQAAVGRPLPGSRATSPAPGPAGQTVFGGTPRADVFELYRGLSAAIDLSPGVPDLSAFPRAAWRRAEHQVLDELPASALGYSDPRGAAPLRRAVSHWLARNRGVAVGPDEVLVVAGVSQALALLAHALRAEGVVRLAVEEPGSLGARQLLQYWGAQTVPVAVDNAGLVVSHLRSSGATAVLVTPAHQFPMGVVLDGHRRRQLLDWAAEGGIVIEDDYDAEHRYDRPPVPALRSLSADRVFYLGSVSKLLAPALRVGWAISPGRYREALLAAKRQSDLGNAVLPQLVLARLIENGGLERHLRSLRARHRARRDAMLQAVSRHLPGALVHGAAAGLHLTVTFGTGTFEAGFDDASLAAAALDQGVKVQPLSWHRQTPGRPGLVLGYASSTPDTIREGIARVGRAVKTLG
jgi:GntR family transcriptional regulator / MocR family aminotransferase